MPNPVSIAIILSISEEKRSSAEQRDKAPEYQKCKVVLIGECAIGKTSFCKAMSGKEFPADYEPTVGSDFYMKNMALGDGLFQFNVWDLSGDQTYVEVRNEFYKESQAIILMYDIARRSSFDALDMWIREASKHGGENLPVLSSATRRIWTINELSRRRTLRNGSSRDSSTDILKQVREKAMDSCNCLQRLLKCYEFKFNNYICYILNHTNTYSSNDSNSN